MRGVIYNKPRALCTKIPIKIGWRGLGCTVYLFLNERRLEIPASHHARVYEVLGLPYIYIYIFDIIEFEQKIW